MRVIVVLYFAAFVTILIWGFTWETRLNLLQPTLHWRKAELRPFSYLSMFKMDNPKTV